MRIYNKLTRNFKSVVSELDWTFFFILLIPVLTPIFYKLFRSILVYSIDSDVYETAIAWGYIYLIFETINMFVVIPAYAFIKKNAKTDNDVKQKSILAFGFALIAVLFTSLIIALFAFPITNKFQNLNSDANFSNFEVYSYISVFGVAISLHLLINIMIAYIILNKRKMTALTFPIVNMFIIMLIDFLFLSPIVNPNASLITISFSSLTSSLLILLIMGIYFLAIEGKEWKEAFKTLHFRTWKKDYSVYWTTGIWLSLEAFVWNLLWILGVTLWISSDVQAAAFWTMDMLFWSVLLVPTTAICLLMSEQIANTNKDPKKQREVVKQGFVLSSVIYLMWLILFPIIIFLIFPLIFNDGTETAQQELELAQRLSCIALVFFIIQVPSRFIYTYFATTEQGFKAFLGTLCGVTLIWLPSTIVYIINPELIQNIEWAVVIYGVGIVVIFTFYLVFWYIENKEWYQPKIDGLWSKLTNYNQRIIVNFSKEDDY